VCHQESAMAWWYRYSPWLLITALLWPWRSIIWWPAVRSHFRGLIVGRNGATSVLTIHQPAGRRETEAAVPPICISGTLISIDGIRQDIFVSYVWHHILTAIAYRVSSRIIAEKAFRKCIHLIPEAYCLQQEPGLESIFYLSKWRDNSAAVDYTADVISHPFRLVIFVYLIFVSPLLFPVSRSILFYCPYSHFKRPAISEI